MSLNVTFSLFNHLKDTLADERQVGSNGISGSYILGYLDDDRLKKVRMSDDFLEGKANTREHIIAPIITFEDGITTQSGFELGSKDRSKNYNFVVSVYAEDDIQAMQLVDYVVSGLDQNSITYKDYLTNYTNPSTLGVLKLDNDSVTSYPVRNLKPSDQSVPVIKIFKHHYEVTFSVSDK